MVEPSEAYLATTEKIDFRKFISSYSKLVLNLLLAARLLGEEIAFINSEILNRSQTETLLFNDFVSRMAEVHSIIDIKTVCDVIGRHYSDFIRRDTERQLKHLQRTVDAWSDLYAKSCR